jgi:hypothetical protein
LGTGFFLKQKAAGSDRVKERGDERRGGEGQAPLDDDRLAEVG